MNDDQPQNKSFVAIPMPCFPLRTASTISIIRCISYTLCTLKQNVRRVRKTFPAPNPEGLGREMFCSPKVDKFGEMTGDHLETMTLRFIVTQSQMQSAAQ